MKINNSAEGLVGELEETNESKNLRFTDFY